MTPKEQATKEEIDKSDFIKITNIFVSKDSSKKVKRQPIKLGESIFKSNIW